MEEIVKNLELYNSEYKLEEHQYLLKVRKDRVGFLTKLTLKNELPIAFKNWTKGYHDKSCSLPIYVFDNFRYSGWKLVEWRFGMSQNWAKVKHPAGFVVEVQLHNLLETLLNTTMIEGQIEGEYRWDKYKGLIDY